VPNSRRSESVRVRWLGAASLVLAAASPWENRCSAQSPDWVVGYGSIFTDWAQDVLSDGSGGVFTCGGTSGGLFGPQNGIPNAWITRHDATGTLLWSKQFGSSGATGAPTSMCSDGGAGFVLAGTTTYSWGGPLQGSSDVWIARFDSSGQQVWLHQFGSSSTESEVQICALSAGDSVVCGTTYGSLGGPTAGQGDAFFSRIDAGGQTLWHQQFGSPGNDLAREVVADPAGGFFACGSTNGNLGGFYFGGETDGWIARFDGAGQLIWVDQLGSGTEDHATGLVADGVGGVFVCGTTDGHLGGPPVQGKLLPYIARYDAAGARLWIRKYTSIGEYHKFNNSMGPITGPSACPDGQGGGFLQFTHKESLTGPFVGAVDLGWAHFDAAGGIDWVAQLGTSLSEFHRQIGADGNGGFFGAGSTMGSLRGNSIGESDTWTVHYERDCIDSETYCVASQTSIPGCQASIASQGTANYFDTTLFKVRADGVPGGNIGLCIFGAGGPANLPFGTQGGAICFQPPLTRSLPTPSGGTPATCDGSYVFTLADLINSTSIWLPIFTPGAEIRAQIWARDSGSPDGFLLSNALKFVVCP
jgi:hypothetical protein